MSAKNCQNRVMWVSYSVQHQCRFIWDTVCTENAVFGILTPSTPWQWYCNADSLLSSVCLSITKIVLQTDMSAWCVASCPLHCTQLNAYCNQQVTVVGWLLTICGQFHLQQVSLTTDWQLPLACCTRRWWTCHGRISKSRVRNIVRKKYTYCDYT